MRSFLKKHDLSLIARAHQVIYSCIFIVISQEHGALSLLFSFSLLLFTFWDFFLRVAIHGSDMKYIP